MLRFTRCGGGFAGATRSFGCRATPIRLVATGGYIASLSAAQRGFLSRLRLPWRRGGKRVTLEEANYDKSHIRYTGTFLGFPTDSLVTTSKLMAGVGVIVVSLYFFAKGYLWLTEFSIQTVARFGFISGFVTCGVLYSLMLMLRRTVGINGNAVYNQSIAIALRHPTVLEHLGSSPRTGDFRAVAHSGGFKLPLLRRVRSGSYELSDLLGLKPRRLQMLFVLKNHVNGKEGLVSVDVVKEKTGVVASVNTFRSLAVVITDPAKIGADDTKRVVIVGTEADMVMRSFTKLH